MMKMRTILFFLFFSMQLAYSQSSSANTHSSPYEKDVHSINSIIKAMYEVISGEAGARDWDRMRYLCKGNAGFSAMGRSKEGGERYFAGTLERYIEMNGPHFEQNAFYEYELGRKTTRFRNLAQVMTTFGCSKEEGGAFFSRGVNSVQLVLEDGRWWIVNVVWTNETPEEPLPDSFLDEGLD